MIFDYAILVTFILSSLLLFIITYLRHTLLRLSKKSDINDLNKFSLSILIFYFFLSFVLLGKLVVIIAMPVELSKFSILLPLFSFPSLFLCSQGFFLACYVFCIAIIVVNWNLQPKYRYSHLASVLKFVLYFALTDLLVSCLGYIKLSFEYLFIKEPIDTTGFWDLNNSIIEKLPLTIIILVLCSFILLWLLKRKFSPVIYYFFSLFFFSSLILEIYMSLYNLQYILDKQMLNTSIIDLLSLPAGFFAWLWFFLVQLAPGALIYGFFLMKMDKYFLNIYYARSYSLQMNQIAFICLAGLSFTALLPNILILFFS